MQQIRGLGWRKPSERKEMKAKPKKKRHRSDTITGKAQQHFNTDQPLHRAEVPERVSCYIPLFFN